ncbi:5-deoxy-glucuronate isomerase [Streptomyces sp. NPDC048442]|uniref:5-deoxy-glucuronate isomerase n=1 Tax=Streptomyces sp. NPDC048442 TaxID=3154823 RepID=UPI00341DC706
MMTDQHAADQQLFVAAGSESRGPYALDIGPKRAGWEYTALRVLELRPGASHHLPTGDCEWIVLPLAGACSVLVDGEVIELLGRDGVFGSASDFAYLPRDAHAQIATGAGGRFALAGARCERRLPARYGPAQEVPVEQRGSGATGREVRNFAAADVFECDRLIAVEVITPGGHWSSYPAHKHDEGIPGRESVLEEIYHYEFDGGPGVAGYQRIASSRPGGADLLTEVRTGDTVLVPNGWHGPSIAPPEHAMYYLNVMAGPGPLREWNITFREGEGYR